MPRMKILIAGGTGFLGSHIVDALLEQGPKDELAVLTRNPGRSLKWGTKVRAVGGDVTEPECLDHATRGFDCIVHCVQFPNHPIENAWKGYTYQRVDGQGTVDLVAAAKRNGVKRFVYLSGAGASPEKPQPWFRAKAMAEKAVRESGIPHVILRPSWVYGPGDRSLSRFIAWTRGLLPPFVPVIGDGRNKVQLISVFDVAQAAAKSVTKDEAAGKTLELGGPEALTMDEILLTIRRVLGGGRPLLHHPVIAMKFTALLAEIAFEAATALAVVASAGALKGLFAPTPFLTRPAIDFILMEEPVDPKPAEALFGMSFARFEDGLKRYVR